MAKNSKLCVLNNILPCIIGCMKAIISLIDEYLGNGMELPNFDDLSGAAFSLMILPVTYNFHPIKLTEGKIGQRDTNARLKYQDAIYIAEQCLTSTKSLFLDTRKSYFKNETNKIKHYAMAIEWMEAAEL